MLVVASCAAAALNKMKREHIYTVVVEGINVVGINAKGFFVHFFHVY